MAIDGEWDGRPQGLGKESTLWWQETRRRAKTFSDRYDPAFVKLDGVQTAALRALLVRVPEEYRDRNWLDLLPESLTLGLFDE